VFCSWAGWAEWASQAAPAAGTLLFRWPRLSWRAGRVGCVVGEARRAS